MARSATIWRGRPAQLFCAERASPEIRPDQNEPERERSRGAMHCEWGVKVNLVSHGAPVTGPSTRSPGPWPSCRRR
jgi:hypothetical protein